METIRIIVSIETNKCWPMYQFDVKSIFLNRALEEEVCEITTRFLSSKVNKIRGLSWKKKALYSFKPILTVWNKRIDSFHIHQMHIKIWRICKTFK